jgi:hypothetical protein
MLNATSEPTADGEGRPLAGPASLIDELRREVAREVLTELPWPHVDTCTIQLTHEGNEQDAREVVPRAHCPSTEVSTGLDSVEITTARVDQKHLRDEATTRSRSVAQPVQHLLRLLRGPGPRISRTFGHSAALTAAVVIALQTISPVTLRICFGCVSLETKLVTLPSTSWHGAALQLITQLLGPLLLGLLILTARNHRKH